MALIVHVASHPDVLVERLGGLVSDPVGQVFDAELVAVPTRGIERWLTQRIASELAARGAGDGICANVDLPSPRRLVRRVLAELPDVAPTAVAWDGATLAARVLDAVDASLDEPWLGVLRRYLDAQPGRAPGANRLAAARKVASLFDRYARRRPDMIRAWASGREVDGLGAPLPRPHQWQHHLWTRVRQATGVPSFPEVLPEGLAPLVVGEVDPALPRRLSVYGLTSVDPLDLEVIRALASRRDVHLYLLHPSPALWEATAERLRSTGGQGGLGAARLRLRGEDVTAGLGRHPMLASWGVESREMQVVLADRGIIAPTPSEDMIEPATALGRLQADIRANRPPVLDPGLAERWAAGRDRSVQLHACHGTRRQVEVLRDAVLHVLADDPGLEPRDVVIMTPDLTTFAPLLEAAFPAGAAASAVGMPDLRLRIADRSPAAVNPLVRFATAVLDLPGSRAEAELVRELVTRPVVQQRFGFDVEGAGEIVRLVDDANVKWGLDESHRREWGLEGSVEQTWGRGLDRALAGVFFSDDPVRVVGDAAPMAGLEGQDTAPAGHLVAIVDRIAAIRELLGGPMPASRWGPAIATAVRLLAAPAWGEEWQWNQLERLLDETFPPAVEGTEPLIGCDDARAAISAWADDRPSPLHFHSGDITVCTLVPMRSVPYRVVCLLGMDDQRFPRSARFDGDDLLVDAEVVGDSDRASEDRQLLLDAVMATGDHLIVTYAGRDELTNAELPPSVPIAELRETLEQMVGRDARIVTTHPLQSFGDANFTPGALGVPGPWSFDARNLDGARAMAARGPVPDEPQVEWPSEDPRPVVTLDDLIRFLQHPARHFVRERLAITIPEAAEVPDDTLTTELTGLDGWKVKERLLAGLAAGHDLAALVDRERAADMVPPGALGAQRLDRVAGDAAALWEAACRRGHRPGAHRRISGTVPIGNRMVTGWVDADREAALRVTVTASRAKASHRLRSFIELAFLSAVDPDPAWTTHLVARNDRGQGDVAVAFGPLGADDVQRRAMGTWVLTRYLDLFDRGHRAPLPMPCATGFAWQRKVSDRDEAMEAARYFWEDDAFEAERRDVAYRLVFPHIEAIEDLVLAGFEHHCERLWAPLLRFMTQERA